MFANRAAEAVFASGGLKLRERIVHAQATADTAALQSMIATCSDTGETDGGGSVSAARAQAVYSALGARGVETKRLMTSGLGGDEPYFDNKTASGRAKNNRVEIVFLYH